MSSYRLAVEYKLKKIKKVKRNKDRSFCDYCGRQLFWYENVPVLSWLIQGGKTRCCGRPLPWEYPLVELGTGIVFLIFLNIQLSVFDQLSISNEFIYLNTIISLVIASLLIFSMVFDLKWMILPDRTNLYLILLALILIIMNGKVDVSILTGLGSLLFFFILNRIKIRGGEAMGMGDVKYSLFMGLFLGWPNILAAVYVAFVVGALVSVGLLLFRVVRRETPIPFGPFLILGTVVAKIWGNVLIKYFLGVLF